MCTLVIQTNRRGFRSALHRYVSISLLFFVDFYLHFYLLMKVNDFHINSGIFIHYVLKINSMEYRVINACARPFLQLSSANK